MKRRKNEISKLDKILKVPEELSSKKPKVTILGFDQALIENHKEILEYQDYYIRLNTHTGIININGFGLNLKEMTSDDILITGKINSFDFEAEASLDEED